MRYTGFVVKTSRHGRIALPKRIREILGLTEKDKITFSIEKDTIILQQYRMKCMITGKRENVEELYPGICLSREGMEILLRELKKLKL